MITYADGVCDNFELELLSTENGMESVTPEVDVPNAFICLASPDRLLCVSFGSDGEVTPTWIGLSETAKSCDYCISRDFNGIIVVCGKSGYQSVDIRNGAIAIDTLTTSRSVKSYQSVLFVNDWGLFCDGDNFYVSDTAKCSTSDILQSKAKVSVNSEIGPQNRLLLSKDKSVVSEMHKVNSNGTDVIIVTTSKLGCPNLCAI